MSTQARPVTQAAEESREALLNGAGAAAVLAAGVGCFALAVLAILADHLASVKNATIFFRPTGPLSGVTTVAVLVWLAVWAALHWRWRTKQIRMMPIATTAVTLLVLALLLTFPPVADLL
jgi:hypothetical protein